MRTGISYLEDGANAARAGLSLSGFDFEALIGANVAIRLNSKKETLLSRWLWSPLIFTGDPALIMLPAKRIKQAHWQTFIQYICYLKKNSSD